MPGAPRRGGGGGERRDAVTTDVEAGRQAAGLPRARGHHQPGGQGGQGGRRFSFTALVVVGDANGMVGVGYGKAKEVPAAIAKGVEEAKKHFFRYAYRRHHPAHVQGEDAAGVVLLKPASPVPVSSPVAGACRARGAGIHDVLSRSLGSSNPINVVHATVRR